MGELFNATPDDSRIRSYLTRLERLADDAGLAFNPPDRVPRTLLPLAASEWVRTNAGDRFTDFHLGLFHAYWAQGRDIEQTSVIADVADQTQVDRHMLVTALDDEATIRTVHTSTQQAQSIGIGGTPYFLLGGRLIIGGAQPREVFDRAIDRLATLGDE